MIEPFSGAGGGGAGGPGAAGGGHAGSGRRSHAAAAAAGDEQPFFLAGPISSPFEPSLTEFFSFHTWYCYYGRMIL